jgi:hypothetical protein
LHECELKPIIAITSIILKKLRTSTNVLVISPLFLLELQRSFFLLFRLIFLRSPGNINVNELRNYPEKRKTVIAIKQDHGQTAVMMPKTGVTYFIPMKTCIA